MKRNRFHAMLQRGARGRGQSLVEVALVLPIFLLLVLLLVDFGRIVYVQTTLNQDAREATRVGSVSVGSLTTSDDWLARYRAIRLAAKSTSVAVTVADAQVTGAQMSAWSCDPLDPPCPRTDCPAPLPADPVAAGYCFYPDGYLSAAIDPGNVYVRITIQFQILTPIISNILGGTLTLSGASQAQIHS